MLPTPFILAIQFLTRLPTPQVMEAKEQEFGDSLRYYPVVGIVIGLVLWSFLALLTALAPNLPAEVSAALVLIVWCWITGGLHLDGLADTADAWLGGNGSRERTLTIMKDSRSGPAGVISICLQLLLKWALVVSLIKLYPAPTLGELLLPLVLSCMLARTYPQLSLVTTPYARDSGLASAMTKHLNSERIISVFIFLTLVTFLLLPVQHFFWVVLLYALLFVLFRSYQLKTIQGFTGDTLGAGIEVLESLVLLSFLI